MGRGPCPFLGRAAICGPPPDPSPGGWVCLPLTSVVAAEPKGAFLRCPASLSDSPGPCQENRDCSICVRGKGEASHRARTMWPMRLECCWGLSDVHCALFLTAGHQKNHRFPSFPLQLGSLKEAPDGGPWKPSGVEKEGLLGFSAEWELGPACQGCLGCT